MKKEKVLKGMLYASVVGFTLLFSSAICVLFKGVNQVLNTLFITGAILAILPLFLGQFACPAGLLDEYGFPKIPLVGKLIIFLFVFPFVNMWLLGTVNVIFNFLPNYYEAINQGKDLITVQTLRQEYVDQFRTLIVLTYGLMVGSGLIFRKIFRKKIQKLQPEIT